MRDHPKPQRDRFVLTDVRARVDPSVRGLLLELGNLGRQRLRTRGLVQRRGDFVQYRSAVRRVREDGGDRFAAGSA